MKRAIIFASVLMYSLAIITGALAQEIKIENPPLLETGDAQPGQAGTKKMTIDPPTADLLTNEGIARAAQALAPRVALSFLF